MSTPEVVESHLQDIHVTALKADTLSDANKPAFLTKFDLPDARELREVKTLNNPKGLTKHSPGFRTITGTLDILVTDDSAVLAIIKTAYAAGTPIFVHCIEDSTASAGAKGFVYECVVGSYPKLREAGTLQSMSVELGVNDFEAI